MAGVIALTEGHYEVEDVELVRVYRWCPERVVVGCGERVVLTASTSGCRCGLNLAAVVRGELAGGGTRPSTPGATPGIARTPGSPSRMAPGARHGRG